MTRSSCSLEEGIFFSCLTSHVMTNNQKFLSFWCRLRATPSFLCQGLEEPLAMNSKVPYISLTKPLFKLQALVLATVKNLSKQCFEFLVESRTTLVLDAWNTRCEESKRFNKKTSGLVYQTSFQWCAVLI